MHGSRAIAVSVTRICFADYADPNRPDCTEDEDGVNCQDESVESCASALGLSIQTVDRSVHVKRKFEIPVHAVDMADEERKALLADMFYRDAMPAIIFTTGIETHRCDDDANMERSACKKQEGRRRAQLARDRSCPHSTFLTKGASMLAACGLELGATELPSTCPSTNCAQQLLSLLDDCTDSLEHAASMEAELYTALAAGVCSVAAELMKGS